MPKMTFELSAGRMCCTTHVQFGAWSYSGAAWASVRLLDEMSILCVERLMGTTCPSCTLESVQHVTQITGRLKPAMVSSNASARMQVL